MFEIELTERAKIELAWFNKSEQGVIIDGIERHLRYQPTSVTRNRKRLRPNLTAEWELRLGTFRVLYNVDEKIRIVSIERVGEKQNNKFLFRGREEEL
jgi:mRNA-degrading endonuclease RelE of RelBE toxin-antitoxin system